MCREASTWKVRTWGWDMQVAVIMMWHRVRAFCGRVQQKWLGTDVPPHELMVIVQWIHIKKMVGD